MKDYKDALEWMEKKAKEYGGKDKFFSSSEYRNAYPQIQKLHTASLKDFSNKAYKAMSEVNAKSGQRVSYDVVGLWGHVERQEGTIVLDKKGVPKVKVVTGLV